MYSVHLNLSETFKNEKSPQGRKLRGLIEQYQARRGAHADLQLAEKCMSSLAHLDSGEFLTAYKQDEQTSTLGQALFTSALIIYARCAQTESKERSNFSVRPFLSAEEKEHHDQLMDLRNKVIAHFGYGRHLARAWNEDVVTLSLTDEGTSLLRCVHTRTNYTGAGRTALSLLIPRAKEILKEQGLKKADEITAALGKMDTSGPEPIMFDPHAFFFDPAAADDWIAAKPTPGISLRDNGTGTW